MKYIRKFLVSLVVLYFSLPTTALILTILFCFLSWTSIPFDGFIYLINPANFLMMRIWLLACIITSLIWCYNRRDSEKYWW